MTHDMPTDNMEMDRWIRIGIMLRCHAEVSTADDAGCHAELSTADRSLLQ